MPVSPAISLLTEMGYYMAHRQHLHQILLRINLALNLEVISSPRNYSISELNPRFCRSVVPKPGPGEINGLLFMITQLVN